MGDRCDRRVEFISACIAELSETLRGLGGALCVLHGRARDEIPALAERLAANGEIGARDVAEGAAEGDVVCIRLIRDGGRRVGATLATLVSFANPSMIVIGGGLAQLGHILLAEIRSVVYRRSLPLATGNLPVVLSELGARAGVSGAAVLASDTAFEQAA